MAQAELFVWSHVTEWLQIKGCRQKFNSIILYTAKVVLITGQQNRRSGSVYAFEQHTSKVYVMAWDSSGCVFLLWKFIELPKLWSSFTHHQEGRRETGFTYTVEELENLVIKLWGFLRYLWCQGCPRDTGMPAQRPCPSLPVKPGQFCESHQQGLGYKAYCFQSFVPEII